MMQWMSALDTEMNLPRMSTGLLRCTDEPQE